MTRAEVLEFLELPESATDNDIRVRMNDKLNYFQKLSENAPNEFLRKLHTTNTEKIKTMQSLMKDVGPVSEERHAVQHHPVDTGKELHGGNKPQVAWLVRHTENQSSKTYPLHYGKNFIGRNQHSSGAPTIVLDEDPYVSRSHALLEVIDINPLQIVVTDDAFVNNGKPSKNGTYINGDENRLTQKVIIGSNDTIQVGMTKLIVRLNNTSIHKIVKEVEESDYMKTVVIDVF